MAGHHRQAAQMLDLGTTWTPTRLVVWLHHSSRPFTKSGDERGVDPPRARRLLAIAIDPAPIISRVGDTRETRHGLLRLDVWPHLKLSVVRMFLIAAFLVKRAGLREGATAPGANAYVNCHCKAQTHLSNVFSPSTGSVDEVPSSFGGYTRLVRKLTALTSLVVSSALPSDVAQAMYFAT